MFAKKSRSKKVCLQIRLQMGQKRAFLQTMFARCPGGRMDVQIVFRAKKEEHWIGKKPL
jgi:hypothetical protein